MIRSVWPIIRNCLGYADQRLVEFACVCVIRVIDAYHRASPENLEKLVDSDLIKAVNLLLLPAGGSPLVAASTFTLLLRALATAARASPKITLVLLEAGIVDTLYQILTGVLPSSTSNSEEQGNGESGQGLGGGLADMTVMENLAHRPKDQVEETLSLITELMPPIPKGTSRGPCSMRIMLRCLRNSVDGTFDHKGYTEKAYARLLKVKTKAGQSNSTFPDARKLRLLHVLLHLSIRLLAANALPETNSGLGHAPAVALAVAVDGGDHNLLRLLGLSLGQLFSTL